MKIDGCRKGDSAAAASHNDRRHIDIRLDRLVRQDASAVDVDLITDRHIVTQHRDVLQTRPSAHGAVPPDDGGLDPGVVLDLGALEQDAALQTHAVADHHVRADGHVGAYSAVLADLGGGVDEDVTAVHVGLGRGREVLAAALGERGQVQTCAAEEVLGLTDVHPEAVQVEGVQLVVRSHGRERLLLDGCRPQLNALEHRGVEEVQPGVDPVPHELDGLLDETIDAARLVGLVDDDTVLGGLLDFGDDDGALVAVVAVEFEQVLEGVVADDVRVEHEEGRVVLEEDLLGELQGTGGVEGFGLDGKLDVDVILLFVLGRSAFHPLTTYRIEKGGCAPRRGTSP